MSGVQASGQKISYSQQKLLQRRESFFSQVGINSGVKTEAISDAYDSYMDDWQKGEAVSPRQEAWRSGKSLKDLSAEYETKANDPNLTEEERALFAAKAVRALESRQDILRKTQAFFKQYMQGWG